ncbi:winged helix-turn-helix domain-containing protein [Dokdonella koreensis]|uniref:Transcriptional regulatory protein, HTH DNA binding domain n=1 Tax=Dokdonella koreensis DS-123 TaxID=1300342 RepID=A0A160DSQ8_9GAMM|nr:transcriptional regulator [Dokdonella koreensis]ANB17347.1 Putative transcriptional regulatory protein, HTH DNA binding domain [Dokdonella koreensis DS-123]
MTRFSYRFNQYELDPAARELRHRGRLLASSPTAFDCLVYLLEHRERAVGRDELVAAVWGQASVSDNLLGKTLLKARRLVGDNGENQDCIRTVPRFGYRWVAEVTCAPIADAPLPEAPQHAAAAPVPAPEPPPVPLAPAQVPEAAPARPARRRRRGAILALAGLVIAAAGVAAVAWLRPAAGPATGATQAAAEVPIAGLIAVLPAEVLADDAWAWLRLGLMDLTANRLRSAGLAVVPSETMVALNPYGRLDANDLSAIGRASRAERLVLTTVRQTAQGWRVVFSLAEGGAKPREIQIHGADVIEASQQATERLLAALDPAAVAPPPEGRSLTELLQRTEAAVLSEDFGRARAWIEAAPEALRRTPELRLRAALVDYRLGRHDEASAVLQALLAELTPDRSPLLRGRALMGLGAIAVRRNQAVEAEPVFSEALRLLPDQGDPVNLGYAYLGRGIGRAMRGHAAEATEDFSRARVVLEATGDSLGLARIDMSEGVMTAAGGAYGNAQSLLERSAERFERLDVPSELGAALGNQIEVRLLLLQPVAAQAIGDRLVDVIGKVENPFERRLLESRRAAALAAAGRFEQAEQLQADIEHALDPAREGELLGRLRLAQAEAARLRGQWESQLAAAQQAAARLEAGSRDQARARWLVVHGLVRLGRPAEAATAGQAPPAAAGTLPGVVAYGWLAQAEQRSGEAAREAYEHALAAGRDAAPQDLAAVVDGYARWLIAQGELEGAAALVGQVARWAEQDFECALLQVRLYHALGQTAAWRAALARARALAGSRAVPDELRQPPLGPPLAS